MKTMNNCLLVMLLAAIYFPLNGMRLEGQAAISHWKNSWTSGESTKNDERLRAILSDLTGAFSKEQKEAANQILNDRSGLLAAVAQPAPAPAPNSSSSASQPSSSTSSNNSSFLNNDIFKYGLAAVMIAGAAWYGTEACFAYKNTSEEEWKHAEGIAQKLGLITSKAGSAMASRPGQAVALGRDVINKVFNRES